MSRTEMYAVAPNGDVVPFAAIQNAWGGAMAVWMPRAALRATPEDVDRSISECLDNIAIRHEIGTAVKTYARARTFLHGLRLQRLGLACSGTAATTRRARRTW
jgi:hypothetical protein